MAIVGLANRVLQTPCFAKCLQRQALKKRPAMAQKEDNVRMAANAYWMGLVKEGRVSSEQVEITGSTLNINDFSLIRS